MQNYIKYLQEMYYAGTPEISNEEYDALVAKYGEDGLGKSGQYEHLFRMYSLDKVYPGRGETFPLNITECVETPKLDGCAISVIYNDNYLACGFTRGDGITTSTCIDTWKLTKLGIPLNAHVHANGMMTQLTGEVVTTKRVPNERNFASGAMQLQDQAEFLSRVEEGGLIFVAYGIQYREGFSGIELDYELDMQLLHQDTGINVVTIGDYSECPQDGTVYRLALNEAFADAGFTHKHPKGAFAVKEDEEAVVTTLLEVVWATGKTGKVTPTAVFEEIIIDDAKISRATLNNAGYIEAMGLEIGDQIQVIRSGGIIPKIIGKL